MLLSLQGLRVMENTAPPRGFARVRLQAAKTHALALGAVVRVTAGGVTQQDYVRITDGFLTQVPAELHFGLGDARAIDRLEVTWPSGGTQAWKGLAAGRLITIREGGEPVLSEIPRWPEETRRRAKPAFSFDIEAESLEGGRRPVAKKGRPAVLNFWAPDCAPCKQELPGLASVAKERPDVQFAGVSLEMEDRAAVRGVVDGFALPYPQFLANETLKRSFFGAESTLPIPSTFVFDGAGRLRRAFLRPVEPGELGALLESLREEGLSADDLNRRGSRLVEQGRYEEGLAILRRALAALPEDAVVHYHIGIAAFNLGRDDEARIAFQQAVRLEPDMARAQMNLAEVLRKTGLYEEAMFRYREVLRIRGEDYNALFGLGDAAASLGQNAAAIEAFDRASRADPKPTGVLRAKAIVHARLGEKEAARAALTRLLELDPGNRDAIRMLESLR